MTELEQFDDKENLFLKFCTKKIEELNFYGSATNHLELSAVWVGWSVSGFVSTQISKQANAPIAKHIIICQDADHNTTVQSVCRTCIHTTGCTTQSDIAQENWHLHVLKFFGISVHIVEGS